MPFTKEEVRIAHLERRALTWLLNVMLTLAVAGLVLMIHRFYSPYVVTSGTAVKLLCVIGAGLLVWLIVWIRPLDEAVRMWCVKMAKSIWSWF